LVDELLKYVEMQMANGYSSQAIREALIRQGYSPALVDGVIESVSMHRASGEAPQLGSSHEKSAFPKLLLILLFLGVVIAGVIYLPGLLSGKQPLLDITVSSDKFAYVPGEELGFNLEIYNMGSAERFDINLNYKVTDKDDNTIFSKEETIAISTSTSYHRSITLPSDITSGQYVLKVFANYGGKVATSSFTFEVKEKTSTQTGTCADKIKNQDETGVDCGGVCGGYWYDASCHAAPKPVVIVNQTNSPNNQQPAANQSCSDGLQNQDEVGVDCGGVCGGYWYDNACHSAPQLVIPKTTQTSFAGIMIQARAAAATNPEDGKNICFGLTKSDERDKCLKTVAEAAMKKEYCDLIIGVSDRDECYYPFFMNGDYTVCEKLTDPQSKQTCENLRDIYAITAQMNQTSNQTG